MALKWCWCGRPVGAHGPAQQCEKPRVRPEDIQREKAAETKELLKRQADALRLPADGEANE